MDVVQLDVRRPWKPNDDEHRGETLIPLMVYPERGVFLIFHRDRYELWMAEKYHMPIPSSIKSQFGGFQEQHSFPAKRFSID